MGFHERDYARATSSTCSKQSAVARQRLLIGAVCVIVAVIGLQIVSRSAFQHRWNAMNPVLNADRVEWVGISWNGVDSVRTKKLGVPDALEILEVAAQSPGANAGLLPRDLIVGVSGKPFSDVMELQGSASTLRPGQTLTLNIVRSEVPLVVSVTLCSWDEIKRLKVNAIVL